jgi:hypothetical protein
VLGNAPHHGGVVMLGNAPHHGGVVLLGNVPHHGGVAMLGLVPHHGGVVMLLGKQCATPQTSQNVKAMRPSPSHHHHHHHHHPTAHPRAVTDGGGWRRGREGGAHLLHEIYCTPPASAHRADGGRSQDLESTPAPNRAGREPAATSHRLNRGAQATSSLEARQVVPRPDAQERALATAKMPEL